MHDITSPEADIAWDTYKTIGPNDALNQGDLIRFRPELGTPAYGIVVTADCDLEKRKHSRLVTLVPFITVEDVIKKSLAFDLFEQQGISIQLKNQCRIRLHIQLGIDDKNFIATVKAILKEGALEPEDDVLARVISHEVTELEISSIKIVTGLLGMRWNNVVDRFKQQIGSRGDMLLLTKPPLVTDIPQVAWLRAIWQERGADIAIRTSEEHTARGLRVAQLKSPYRYRLTQMLGSVFADIGVPDVPKQLLEKEIKALESL